MPECSTRPPWRAEYQYLRRRTEITKQQLLRQGIKGWRGDGLAPALIQHTASFTARQTLQTIIFVPSHFQRFFSNTVRPIGLYTKIRFVSDTKSGLSLPSHLTASSFAFGKMFFSATFLRSQKRQHTENESPGMCHLWVASQLHCLLYQKESAKPAWILFQKTNILPGMGELPSWAPAAAVESDSWLSEKRLPYCNDRDAFKV